MNSWFCDWGKDVSGSPENAVILNHLFEKDFKLVILHPGRGVCKSRIENFVLREIKGGNGKIGKYIIGILNYLQLNLRAFLKGFFLMRKRKFDGIYSIGVLLAPASFLLGRLKRVKTILKTPGTFELVRVKGLKRLIFYFQDVIALKLDFDHFLLVDDGTATYRYIEQIGKKNYTVLPNPYPGNFEVDLKLRFSFRKKIGIPEDAKVAGWASRYHPLKGKRYLKDIVLRVLNRGHHVLIAGVSESDFPLSHERLHLLGFIPHEEMEGFFNAIDVLMSTNIYSQYVLPVLEAQYMGIPVVGFDELESYKAILDGVTGFLIKERDVEEFASKVSLLLEDDELRRRMGERAKNFIREKHIDWNRRAKLEEDVILRILEHEEAY